VPILDTEHIICDYCYEEGKTCDACESIISDKIKICQEDLEKCFGYEDITNILPKWNIPEDNAVLFLSEKDSVKYSANYNTYFTYPDCINAINIIEQNGIDDVDCIKYYKTISIIIPELHAEDQSCPYHIDNINNVCKELKEKYGVERIELFVSHCFLRADDHSLFCYQEDGKMCMNYRPFYDWSIEPPFIYLNFDFLTTTNSTQNIDTYNQHDKNESNEFYKKEKNNYESRLEVIDVIEFFNI
jgi:hypothetical protein